MQQTTRIASKVAPTDELQCVLCGDWKIAAEHFTARSPTTSHRYHRYDPRCNACNALRNSLRQVVDGRMLAPLGSHVRAVLDGTLTVDDARILTRLRTGVTREVRDPDLSPVARKQVRRTSTGRETFPERFKKAIHARAKGRCEGCGGSGLAQKYRHAHHIDAKDDHRMENGASICGGCHAAIHQGTPEESASINDKLRALRADETMKEAA